MKNETTIIYGQLGYVINGILFEVHNELGQFCNEQQYCDVIEERLKNDSRLEYKREYVLPPSFKGEQSGRNRVDFYIKGLDGELILEVKVKRILDKQDFLQVMRYLVASNKKLAILVNFKCKYIAPKRILNPSAPV